MRADALETIYGGELEELSHVVRVRVDDGFARYVVRRTARNTGAISDKLGVSISLPTGAVAVGMRVRTGGRWHTARLERADVAAERYAELTNIFEPREARVRTARRRPTLLAWSAPGQLTLETFPVRVGEELTYEYTLRVPTCYAAGRIWLDYPLASGAGLARPLFAVETGGHGTAVVHLPPAADDARPVGVEDMCGAGTTPYDGSAAVIEVEPRDIDAVALRYGVYRTAAKRAVARLDIDAAAVLEPAPRDARVVFVMDGSYSTGDAALTEQLALARGYLAHVPDARVEVVVFRRHAERLLGDFVPAASFDERVGALAGHRLALGNGSNLEDGVALAANLLATGRGPARVVVFTDARTRDAFTPELAVAALATLPDGGVVHVALRTTPHGELGERRDDEHPLTSVAAAYGGVVLDLFGAPDDEAAVARAMLGLVRPIRIDDFELAADGDEPLESLRDGALAEGEGERYMLLLADAPRRLRASGMIWGRRWERAVEVSPGFADALPALVFGHALHAVLDVDEQRAAATRAGAVSPQTSYLEAEPRVVPIPDDLRDFGGIGLGSYSTCGCGGSFSTSCGIGGIGTGGGAGWEDRPTPEQLLARWMRPKLAQCARAAGAEALAITLTLEATGDEIVDVSVDGELSVPARSCVVDAAWELRLTDEFTHDHGYYSVALEGALD